jgi:peptidoglycan/LPS O-acetylase OafA/YrhL
MSDPVRRFSYIDALRGYAILMVIAVHSSQPFSDLIEYRRATRIGTAEA